MSCNVLTSDWRWISEPVVSVEIGIVATTFSANMWQQCDWVWISSTRKARPPSGYSVWVPDRFLESETTLARQEQFEVNALNAQLVEEQQLGLELQQLWVKMYKKIGNS